MAPLAPPDASFKHPGVFEVPGGDYLVAVSVGWGRQAPGYPANEVITLQFETHKGLKSPVYGGGSGRMDVSSFSLRAPEGQQIIGLFGARGGNQGLLIRVGAYVAPAPSPGPQPEGAAPSMQFLSGSFWTGRQEGAAWKLVQGSGDREFVKRVTFSRRFDTPPQVVVGSSLLDVDQSKVTRAEVSARNATPEGFDLVLRTWGDSIVHSLGANWLALEPGRVGLSAGSFGTGFQVGAAWKLVQGMGEREYVKHVTFTRRFDTPPQVVVGSSLLDVDQSKNTRVEVTARNATPEGFDLVLRTWSDSIVNNLGANWLALEPGRVALSAGSFSTRRGQDAGWSLDQGSGEREYVKHVTFSRRFDTPPQVVVGSSLLDVDQSNTESG
ncbi:MAG: hypothetical protein JOZ63_18685, partial [Planctomycetaceae bacterium]|nr:hypothetical protein [Planctomycetaceae bacterium]